ncbi:MAG: hypothetical protein ABSG86_30750 [Thermoguttaceae bacterium]|jgi:hypothetical protein
MSGVYTFALPHSFDVSEFLPARLWTRADDARWLVSVIVRKTANRDTDPWGCVRLDSQILRRVMYQGTVAEIVRALEDGAIEIAPYCVGIRCKGFRLAKRYLGDRCVRVPVTDPRLLDRIERERQRLDAAERQTRWKPIHYRLDAEQRALTIDGSADAILTALPAKTRLCQDVLVSYLRRREFPFSVGSTGRVFNAITGLKRELRAALRIGGEPVGSVDIRCAQPALLALAMTQKSPLMGQNGYQHISIAAHPAPACPCPSAAALAPDGAVFADLAVSGCLYETLGSLTGLDRETIKLAFLRDVLAKRGRYPSAVEQAFSVAFPTVYGFVRRVNRRDHAELIRLLQRLESWLVVETVCPRLVGHVPVVTLHDAVFSTRHNLAAVEGAFRDTFGEIGFSLSLKREAIA